MPSVQQQKRHYRARNIVQKKPYAMLFLSQPLFVAQRFTVMVTGLLQFSVRIGSIKVWFVSVKPLLLVVRYAVNSLTVNNLLDLRRRTRVGWELAKVNYVLAVLRLLNRFNVTTPHETEQQLSHFLNERWKVYVQLLGVTHCVKVNLPAGYITGYVA